MIVEKKKDEREANEKLGDRVFRKYVEVNQLFDFFYPSLKSIFASMEKSPSLEVNIYSTINNIAEIPNPQPRISEF